MVYLEGRVALLETNRSINYFTQPPIARCPMCGIDLNKPMGYVCSATNCPSFPK